MKKGYLIALKSGIDNISEPELEFKSSDNELYFSSIDFLDFIIFLTKHHESEDVIFEITITQEK